jgi:L,D-transpeptidase ErfK/SrfK
MSIRRRYFRDRNCNRNYNQNYHWMPHWITAWGSTLLVLLAQHPALAQTLRSTSSGPVNSVHDELTTADVDPIPLPARMFRPHYPLLSLSTLPSPQPIFPEAAPETRLVIRLRERRVYVYRDDQLYTSYPVAIGRAGWETPTGEYEIISMVQNPGWQNPFTGDIVQPGPNNPLGERWLGFWTDGQNYIGFHGTPNEQSVGRAASHGCVRMYNRDIREMFEMVSMGTPVKVEP